MANRLDADLFVSIHANAHKSKRLNGHRDLLPQELERPRDAPPRQSRERRRHADRQRRLDRRGSRLHRLRPHPGPEGGGLDPRGPPPAAGHRRRGQAALHRGRGSRRQAGSFPRARRHVHGGGARRDRLRHQRHGGQAARLEHLPRRRSPTVSTTGSSATSRTTARRCCADEPADERSAHERASPRSAAPRCDRAAASAAGRRVHRQPERSRQGLRREGARRAERATWAGARGYETALAFSGGGRRAGALHRRDGDDSLRASLRTRPPALRRHRARRLRPERDEPVVRRRLARSSIRAA